MNRKSTLSAAMAVVVALSATFAYKTYAATNNSEPEEVTKPYIYSMKYEHYMPEQWFTTTALGGNLTRKDAAYMVVYAYAKATGQSVDWMDYGTTLKDTKDPIFSKAINLGLMSVGTDLKFNATKTVSNEEFAVMLTKLASKLGAYQKPKKAMAYKDAGKIASWAKESVQYEAQNYAMNWIKNKNYEPKKIVTVGRALSLLDQFMTQNKVYPALRVTPLNDKQKFEVKGFKIPSPVGGLTELDIRVLESGNLNLAFDGIINDRGNHDYKDIIYQLVEILDSRQDVSYACQNALVTQILSHYDSSQQVFDFKSVLYIRLDNGDVSQTPPQKAYLEIQSGKLLSVTVKP